MKDMAIHTRVNPGERMKRLTNFANRLLSTKEVKGDIMLNLIVLVKYIIFYEYVYLSFAFCI